MASSSNLVDGKCSFISFAAYGCLAQRALDERLVDQLLLKD
jgi:hypothetical protein